VEVLVDLKTIGLLVGILLQLVGLVVVIFQLKKVNTSIRVSAQAALYQQSSTVRSTLIEHPALRKYFFDGAKISSDSGEYDRVKTIGEMFLNYLEHLVIQEESLRQTDFSAWNNFVYSTISASPIMQAILDEKPECYSRDLLKSYEAGRASHARNN